MKKGDQAIVYHTGAERAAVGLAEVASAPYPDPAADDDRVVVVDLKVGKKLPMPVTLSDIKADPAFTGWDLLRISRLSVVPVPEPMWGRLMERSGISAANGPTVKAKGTKVLAAKGGAKKAKPRKQ